MLHNWSAAVYNGKIVLDPYDRVFARETGLRGMHEQRASNVDYREKETRETRDVKMDLISGTPSTSEHALAWSGLG